MLTKLCLSVFLLSSVVFGLLVEHNEFIGLEIEYPPDSARSLMNGGINGRDRIFGGRETAVGQFPHQVSIRVLSDHFCGGSILNERFILTAGHCVNGSELERFRVVVGAHKNKDDNATSHTVQRLIVHEDLLIILNPTTRIVRNDIALVQTVSPIQFNDLVRPIPLHPGFIETEKAVTSGWGRTNDVITNLKFLNVNTLTNDECRRLITAEYPRPPPAVHDYDTICAFSGRRQHGVCGGDSGGPLVAGNQLIGVTSWVYPCGRGVPDGFTRVSTYIEWINSNMRKFQDI